MPEDVITRPASSYDDLDQLYANLDLRLYAESGGVQAQMRTAEVMFYALELERMFGPVGAAIILKLEARVFELEAGLDGLDGRLAGHETAAGLPQSSSPSARTITSIISKAASAYRCTPRDVRSDANSPAATAARLAAIWGAIEVLGLDAARVGPAIGGRGAEKVRGMFERAKLRRSYDEQFRSLTDSFSPRRDGTGGDEPF